MGEVLSIPQAWYMHYEEMKISRRAIRLDERSYKIDVVNTIREDIRDLWGQRSGQVDNLMVVNTLIFSCSVDLSYQGPTPDEALWLLVAIYGCCLAVTVLLPFWSIYFALNVKRSLSSYLTRVLLYTTQHEMGERMNVQLWHQHYLNFETFWREYCEKDYNMAQICFWMGMVFLLISLSYLIGMTYYYQYADTDPLGWRTPIPFVGVVWANFFVAGSYFCCGTCCKKSPGGSRVCSLWCRRRLLPHCCCIGDYGYMKKKGVEVANWEEQDLLAMKPPMPGFSPGSYPAGSSPNRSPSLQLRRQVSAEDIFGLNMGDKPEEDEETPLKSPAPPVAPATGSLNAGARTVPVPFQKKELKKRRKSEPRFSESP